MGLTIHYRLGFPAKTVLEARPAIEQLRQRCLDLPFKEVGEVKVFEGKACNYESCQRDDRSRWLLIQSRGRIDCVNGDRGRCRPVQEDEQWTTSFDVIPETIVAFSTWPGEGCEEANLGLRVMPARLRVHTDRGEPYWLSTATRNRGWTWKSFCKTEYANNPKAGGVKNFLRCHLSVIAALDSARDLGFSVEVNDEGGFWDKRSVQSLAQEVGVWDCDLAAMFGAIKDGMGGDKDVRLVGEIAKRPDFEHLEAAGATNPKLANMLAVIRNGTGQRAEKRAA